MKKIKSAIIDTFRFVFYPVIWFAQSFQGTDGKASGKKFTAAFMTVLTWVYSTRVHNSYTLYAFIALLMAVLMMWGIISSNNIITFTRLLKNKKEDKEDHV
jgi:hypothetical protein